MSEFGVGIPPDLRASTMTSIIAPVLAITHVMISYIELGWLDILVVPVV